MVFKSHIYLAGNWNEMNSLPKIRWVLCDGHCEKGSGPSFLNRAVYCYSFRLGEPLRTHRNEYKWHMCEINLIDYEMCWMIVITVHFHMPDKERWVYFILRIWNRNLMYESRASERTGIVLYANWNINYYHWCFSFSFRFRYKSTRLYKFYN